MRRALFALAFVAAGLVSSVESTPVAAVSARCRKPCTTTTTAAPSATTSTTAAPAPTTTSTSVVPATTTTTTTVPPTTTTTAAPTTTTTTAPATCTGGIAALESATTPDGVRLRICTAVGGWTTTRLHALLTANGTDLDVIGGRLVIEVSTARPSSTGNSAACCDAAGGYYNFRSTMSLNPSSTSSFANAPDAVFAHEFGHAWTGYWLYMNTANAGQWTHYRNARWVNADGSEVLAQSPKLNSSYNWTDHEMAADDYRLLFGSAEAQAQLGYLNSSVPDPRQVPGLTEFFLGTWR